MTLHVRPLGRVTLIESLAGQLEERILSGELGVGAKLPSEEQLAAQFEVSRPVVREALARLRERGLLDTVNGSGTFVRHPEPEQLADALLRQLQLASGGPSSLGNLFEARLAVETACARLAAERATPMDKVNIRQKYEAMKDGRQDPEAWASADLAFHLAIADASHNPFLATLLLPLIEVIHLIVLQGHENAGAVDHGILMHGRLAEAIDAADPEGAASAMVEHMHRAQRNVVDVRRNDGS